MKEIKLNGSKHSIPVSWKDITLDDYIYLKSLNAEDRLYDVKFVSKVTGISVDDFLSAEKSLYEKIVELMSFLRSPIPKVEKKDISSPRYRKYVTDLLENSSKKDLFLERSREVVDGKGLERVSEIILNK